MKCTQSFSPLLYSLSSSTRTEFPLKLLFLPLVDLFFGASEARSQPVLKGVHEVVGLLAIEFLAYALFNLLLSFLRDPGVLE